MAVIDADQLRLMSSKYYKQRGFRAAIALASVALKRHIASSCGGKVPFVDFTAAYCTICKANKKVAVNTPEVVDKIKALDVLPFQGDFTTGDERISAMLKQYDRAGVPLNLIYPAGRPEHPIVLRPNLTKQYLLDKLDEAATSRSTVAASQPPAIPVVHHSSP